MFHDLGVVGEKVSNIILDYAVGIDEAVHHLVSLGHSKIAHIAGSHEIHSAGVRQQAFVDSDEKPFARDATCSRSTRAIFASKADDSLRSDAGRERLCRPR